MNLPSCLPADIAVADGPLRDKIVVQHDDVRFVAFLQTAAFAELEAFVLRCIKYTKTISFSGVYNENYPFALIYDAQSRRLFVSFAPAAKDYNTFVYEPQKDSIVKNYVTDESVANYIARNILNDIEGLL